MLLLAGVLAFGRTGFAPSAAQTQMLAETTSTLPRTITVGSEGTVKIKPDITQTNISVEVMESAVKEASKGARDTMEAILEALKEQGVDEKDIQTSGFGVWTERPYGLEGPSGDELLYHVSNQVAVTIRDLDTVETVLGAAIEAGANNIYGVTFSEGIPSARRIREGFFEGAVAMDELRLGLSIPEYDDEGAVLLKLADDEQTLSWEELEYPEMGLSDGGPHYLPQVHVDPLRRLAGQGRH